MSEEQEAKGEEKCREKEIQQWNEVDVAYWKEHGWTEKARPWK